MTGKREKLGLGLVFTLRARQTVLITAAAVFVGKQQNRTGAEGCEPISQDKTHDWKTKYTQLIE